MSLIICSNKDDNYEAVDVEGFESNLKGDSSASSFTNHFSNVFTLPRNCEVAVQSIKIDRKNILNLKHTRFMSVFMGKALTTSTSYRDSVNLPLVVAVPPGKYGVVDLARKIQEAIMRDGFETHPDYFGQCSVVPNFSNTATGDSWKGWKFEMNTAGSQGGTNNSDTLLRWAPANPGTALSDFAITHEGSGILRVKKANDAPNRYITGIGNNSAQDMPLSLLNGEFEIAPFGQSTTQYWECGLARPLNAENPCPPWCKFDSAITEGSISGANGGFMDYKLTWAERADGKHGLFIEQAIVLEGSSTRRNHSGDVNYGNMEMIEVRYFGITGKSSGVNVVINEDNVSATLNTTGGTTKYSKFKFVVVGEEVELQAFGSNKNNQSGSWEVVIKTSNYKAVEDPESGADTFGNGEAYKVPTCFKAINQNQFNLYPVVGLNDTDDYIEISKWASRPGSGVFPTTTSPGTSQWAKSWDDVDDVPYGFIHDIRRVKDIDTGLFQNGVLDTPHYDKVLLNTHGEAPAYQLAIMPQSITETGYGGVDDYIYSSIKGNSGRLLGFGPQTAILQTEQGLSFRLDATTSTTPPSANWQVYSTEIPVLSSSTAFVRCPTLTHQSLNMAKELPSKILYHIPRFSNTGKEYGNLFHEPTEKTYLALKNTEELRINDLRVDICNTDETLCDDLTGQTTLVLHFRKSRV